MKETEQKKMYFFVDESGDTTFFDKKGNNLVKAGKVSRIFIVGYLETEDIHNMHKTIESARAEICNDMYLADIPSLQKSRQFFHAKDDCPEVREKVFKAIRTLDIKFHCVVIRKQEDVFRKRFSHKIDKAYAYAVEHLFENRLHLYSDIDIYFSKMGNKIRELEMKNALENAKDKFKEKWNHSSNGNIRIFIQTPTQMAGLQVIDYLLWSVFRVFEKKEMRYFRFVEEKISLVNDILDTAHYPNTFYTRKNPLDINKISPLEG